MSHRPPSCSNLRPRWQRRPQARPDEILDAARKVFGDRGFARARLEEVARAAGISKGTLYLYFDSKETLFRETVRSRIVALLAESEAIVESHQGPYRDLLPLLIRGMFRCMRDPEVVKISRVMQAEFGAFPELARFYFDEVILRARRLVERVLDLGTGAGEFRPVAGGFGARAIPSLLVHSAQMQFWFGRIDPDALTDREALEGLIEFCMHGLLAPPAART